MSMCRYASLALPAMVLLSLASFRASATVTNATTSTHVSNWEVIAATTVSGKPSSTKLAVPTVLIAGATGNLLSPAQKAALTQLPIPVVAPTVLPASFRLVRAEGEANRYVNGDDDSGYTIDYQGDPNTCLSIRTSQDGPRGLAKVKQVQTRFGLITVYTEKLRDSQSLVSFLGIKGNPMVISGGMRPDGTANGGWEPCHAVSVETYTQILRSLAVVK